jgi:hypothetical protein
MTNAYASALEISARIIRENLVDPTTARRLITEKLHAAEESSPKGNQYVLNMQEGYRAVLGGLYAIAQRGESA